MISSLLLAILGCSLLILAPGNFIRSSAVSNGIMAIAYRGYGQINAFCNWLFIPILANLVLFSYMHTNKIKIDFTSKILFIWAILSMIIMIASPTYPSRATFGSFVILTMAFLANFQNFETNNIQKIFIYMMWLAAMLSIFAFSIVNIARLIGFNIPG